MGLFDKIKTTAQSAVNSVTGNPATPQPVQSAPQPVPQQAPQPVQPQQQFEQGMVPQAQPQNNVPAQAPQAPRPQNSDPNTFFGKEYRGTGFGAGTLMKSTYFFEDHLQYGGVDIPYSDLTEITITGTASKMLNGTAQTLQKSSNTVLTLTFNTFVLGFEKGVDYANEKIAEANGNGLSRKAKLRSPNGSKLDLYEDYISINRQGGGLSGLMGSNDTTEIIMISSITGIDASSGTQIVINYNNDDGVATQSAFVYNPADTNTVNEIIGFVQSYAPEVEEAEETWKLVTGSAHEFPLLGKTLTVNENWDVFNSYRTMYMECAARYTQQMKKKYIKRITNFDSFMRFYLPLYKEYLDKIINKTTDILVSAGVWTETSESIMQRHIENNHLAMDDYTSMYESLVATVQSNKQSIEAVTSFVPNLVGGGFGLKGAVKGIATATAFNLLRDGAESALIDSMNISGVQKSELYSRINQKVLFDRAFLDLWRVFLTLIDILNENGKNVWRPNDSDSAKADNIMKNVSNPNFPQEQFPDVMVAVIGMNPYKRSVYELLRSRGADANEVSAISEYFGYTDNTPDCVG